MFQFIHLILSEVKIIWSFNATKLIGGQILENLCDMAETGISQY